MKVGILGSGDVGQALAKGFVASGYDVMIATRNPNSSKAKDLQQNLGLSVGTFEQTAEFAELIVLCTLWSATKNAIALAGPKNLVKKIVIDTTNPLTPSSDSLPELTIGHTSSAGEQNQALLKDSYVVKAFNIVGNQLMYKPKCNNITPTMFYCGNDAKAKKVVAKILVDFGWDPVDIGDITGSRELEPLCILWVKYGALSGYWDHVFALIRAKK